MSQGAEFALKLDETGKKFTIWSIIGRIVVYLGADRIKVEEGQQVVLEAGGKPHVPLGQHDLDRKWPENPEGALRQHPEHLKPH